MHEAALALAGLQGSYLAFRVDPEGLPGILPALLSLGFRGLNVTVPLKERVIPLLCGLSDAAREIGAVNTLVATPVGWEGANTDAPGFAEAYLGGLPPCPALVLGAGGAARAALQALLDGGFQPSVSARREERAQLLALEFSRGPDRAVGVVPWRSLGGPWRLVVNALSASSPEELGADPPRPRIQPGGLMADLNYGRPDCWFRSLADASGAVFRDGIPMLACQARLSFALWTGLRDVPLDPFILGAGKAP
jgi:shikimate dehydrogenase